MIKILLLLSLPVQALVPPNYWIQTQRQALAAALCVTPNVQVTSPITCNANERLIFCGCQKVGTNGAPQGGMGIGQSAIRTCNCQIFCSATGTGSVRAMAICAR